VQWPRGAHFKLRTKHDKDLIFAEELNGQRCTAMQVQDMVNWWQTGQNFRCQFQCLLVR